MTEIVKKRKISGCCVQVQESETKSVPQSSNSAKKPAVIKIKRFTIEEKQKILEDSKNLTSRQICAKYGIERSTLSKWKAKKDMIENTAKWSSTKTLKKVSMKAKLDDELFTWLSDCRCKGVLVSELMLCQQVLIIYFRIGGSGNSIGSHEWLEKWKERTQIENLNITREKLLADKEAANLCRVKFAELVAAKKLERAQIFDIEESELMYKSTPKRTFVPPDHTQALNGKNQLEEVVTIATCCNADGSYMLPLILIGKENEPCCLRNINKNELPVWYRSQTNARMNGAIFEEWFKDVFVPEVKTFLNSKNLPMKAILLIDGCESPRYIKINEIIIYFFPPHVTSLMDQGIIETVKLYYGMNLGNSVFEAQNANVRLIEFLKTVDFNKVIYWIADAWKKVKSTTIDRCRINIWPKETKDASTQTDEGSPTTDNLDVSVGTDVPFTPLFADDRNENDLLNHLKKNGDYETVDAAPALNWIQKPEKQVDSEEFNFSEVLSLMEEFGSPGNIKPPFECAMEQNDSQQKENNFNCV